MNIFITATDTNVGKTYVSKGIVKELIKRSKKTGYFKPLQSGEEYGIPSDADMVRQGVNLSSKNLITKNSYVTKTPCTPSISAEIDNVAISLDKIEQDYKKLEKECDIVITEGSGGLFVPVNEDYLISDVIKRLNLPVIVVIRPDLGTINHTLLTLNALHDLNIKILGIVISNYPKETKDPAILTAPKLIEKFAKKFGDIKILNTITQGEDDFRKIVDEILKIS